MSIRDRLTSIRSGFALEPGERPIEDQILRRAGEVAVERIDQIKPFLAHAQTVAKGAALTPAQALEVGERVGRRALVWCAGLNETPSRGAIRDAAAKAVRDAVSEVSP